MYYCVEVAFTGQKQFAGGDLQFNSCLSLDNLIVDGCRITIISILLCSFLSHT